MILRFFPKSDCRLVEPFAGSAAMSIAASMENRAECFWVNDIHEPLISLWREIIHHPERISRNYSRLWTMQQGREREFFNDVRKSFNKNPNASDFLYLLARCVKAAVRYNTDGEFNNSPDNRRKGAKPKEMSWRIFTASELLKNRTLLSSVDYRSVLQDCSNDDLVYMDPPYQGVCGSHDHRYRGDFDHEEFCVSLTDLVGRDIMFAVSYDGRTGTKTHGKLLPESLNLTRVEICAGPSTQATLLGRSQLTFESLYISPTLRSRIENTKIPARALLQKKSCEDLFDRAQQ